MIASAGFAATTSEVLVPNDTTFAARLRWWREHRGLSQLALAARTEISQRHLSFLELERASPSREMVDRLATALDIPLRQHNALLLAAGFAPMLPWWVPAGQPPGQFLAMIGRYPGVPAALAWGVVLVVVVLLCSDAESRDYLLGHGKALSVVSVGALLAVLTMTMVGWSVTY